MECPTCVQPFTEFRHQAIGSRKQNAKLKHLYRPDPPAVPESASTGRTTRSDEPTVSTRRTVRFQIDGETFTVDAENFIDVFINDNLLVNNVAQAQARYDLLGIIIADAVRIIKQKEVIKEKKGDH